MGVPMVNKCCFCVSLQTGTLIIGYLYSIWALLELTSMCLMVTFTPIETEEERSVSKHKYVFYIVGACISGVHLLCSVLLVVGVYKKLASLTLPWTIVTGVLTAMFFVMSLTGVSLILQDTGELLEMESIFIFVHLARACLSVYCIIVVHSRHKEIMNEKHERRFQHSGRIYKPVTIADENVL